MSDSPQRLETELSLLEAMYPEQMHWDPNSRELKYRSNGDSFQMRLPDGYPSEGPPQVLSATIQRNDVREQLRKHISACPSGDEVLDSVVLALSDLSETSTFDGNGNGVPKTLVTRIENPGSTLTVVVWLHHLLNANKRKQTVSPSSPSVSGVTKPGYPCVLVCSGPSEAVREHVNELRQLKWQAFQIRLESEEEWAYLHGSGVKEVESMKDLIAEVQHDKRDAFLEAMRIK